MIYTVYFFLDSKMTRQIYCRCAETKWLRNFTFNPPITYYEVQSRYWNELNVNERKDIYDIKVNAIEVDPNAQIKDDEGTQANPIIFEKGGNS